jgi:[acyl-carrier-protein] S-malonyltransferase
MTGRLAFVFPGQGSQQIGMGQEIADAYPEAAAVFAHADKILGFPISRLCWRGPEEDLNDTYNTQPAIFISGVAILRALRAAGYQTEPDFVAGHSLGEYTAYVAAGALNFENGLRLVRERGRLMKKAGEQNPGSMAAILALDDETVARVCAQAGQEAGWVQVANYNCPGQVVISGSESGIDRAVELATAAGARRAQKLAVSIAAHSKLMSVVGQEFRAAVEAAPLNKPQIPIIANNSAQPLLSPEAIRAEMVEQLTSSLLWTQSVQYMLAQGTTHFVEIGKDVISGLIKRIDRQVSRTAVETPADINKLMEA